MRRSRNAPRRLPALAALLLVACTDQHPLAVRPAGSPSEPTGTESVAVPAAALSITIVPGAEIYRVGQTAHFDVTILRDGAPLEGSSATVTATFPDETRSVALTPAGPGAYTFESVLAAAGLATLTVDVLHDYGGATEAIQGNIDRIEAELAELRAELEAATDGKAIHVLQVRIVNRETTLAHLQEKLATMRTPRASAACTITVLPGDDVPPVFGRRWPQPSNGATWVADPFVAVEVEVQDEGSGVETVSLFLNGSPEPIPMVHDPALGRYRYLPAAPWPEGVPQQVEFVARDGAGNESGWGFLFTADYAPPRVLSYSPTETTDWTPLVEVRLTDDVAGIDLRVRPTARIDGAAVPCTLGESGGVVALSCPVTDPLTPGIHWVRVTAVDHAGNLLDVALPLIVR